MQHPKKKRQLRLLKPKPPELKPNCSAPNRQVLPGGLPSQKRKEKRIEPKSFKKSLQYCYFIDYHEIKKSLSKTL